MSLPEIVFVALSLSLDAAIVAADRVLPDGEVVARVGTAVAARLCQAHGIPFYVMADTSRWAQPGDELARFIRERRAPSEILKDVPPGVQVVNLASDLTPAELVTAYISECKIQNAKFKTEGQVSTSLQARE